MKLYFLKINQILTYLLLVTAPNTYSDFCSNKTIFFHISLIQKHILGFICTISDYSGKIAGITI